LRGHYAAEGVIDLGLGLGRMNTAVDNDKVGEGKPGSFVGPPPDAGSWWTSLLWLVLVRLHLQPRFNCCSAILHMPPNPIADRALPLWRQR